MELFQYNEVPTPEGSFKISPSSIGEFFDNPVMWFKKNVTKEERFEGVTATELGTVVHGIVEARVKNIKITKEEVDAWIDATYIDRDDIDTIAIKENYYEMAMALIDEYINKNKPTEVETPVVAKVKNNVYVAGTCDNRTHDTVVDYKTTSTKPNTETIPFKYLIQALAYAYAYRQNGTDIERVRIVYTVRKTKTLPVRVFEVTKVITQDDWQLIEDTLELIAESVEFVQANPQYAHLIFKSMKIKGNYNGEWN